MLRTNVKVNPFTAGLVLGFCAALIQAFFKLSHPLASGFCMVCHPGDMVNWVTNHLFHTHWPFMSRSGPMLTALGVVLGSALAASHNNELQIRPYRDAALYFCCGFLSVKFGQFLVGCPIRVVLLTAYGSLAGFVGVLSVAFGVVVGTIAIRYRAIREVARRVEA